LPTDRSAAVLGNGTAAICFNIFKSYADNFLVDHRELFEQAVQALMPERLIEAPQLPKTASTMKHLKNLSTGKSTKA
jgi:trans-aconitate methyltransferase